MKVNGFEGPQRAQREKGVMTFDRPALTGQGTDREVGDGGGAEMYQEAHGWGRHAQRPSQCSDQACHPSVTLSYGLTLRNTLGI